MPAPVSILLVNQIHHHLYHYVLLFRLALGNHQREGHEGVVGDALSAVFVIEDAVVIEEPEKQSGCDALLPSLNEWFLVTRYSNIAAFSSTLG